MSAFNLQLPEKQECKELLAPYFKSLADCVIEGVERYKSCLTNPWLAKLDKPALFAQNIHDSIVEVIKESQHQHSTWNFLIKKKLPILLIADNIAIRFNKLNNDCTPSTNNSTYYTKSFKNKANPQLELYPERVKLYCGWTLNATNTDIKDIYLVCMYGETVYWSFSLNGGIDYQLPQIILPEDDSPIVTLKKGLGTKTATGTDNLK